MSRTSTATIGFDSKIETTESMAQRYLGVRRATERLCAPLKPEDCVIQSMPDVSPTRWHLAHTTWFFETMVLKRASDQYHDVHPAYAILFNSYYNSIGAQYPRPRRGFLSRPTVADVFDYRRTVDRRVADFLTDLDGQGDAEREWLDVIEVGLHHEQQHQELILTDIKHVFSQNPLAPVYRDAQEQPPRAVGELEWIAFPEGLRWIGHDGTGFCYDNERSRHRQFVEGFKLASRLITNAEYLEFIEDEGYQRPEFWLSDGWAHIGQHKWEAPLYWQQRDGEWFEFTLGGLRPLDPTAPVCHVSFYEADAFARWRGVRLPTEAEWETAAETVDLQGNFMERERFHPAPPGRAPGTRLSQMMGDVWEWTGSQYRPYPGYRPPSGALGEYNGKFMCNQFVLRGGSCATPRAHVRRTYRNFFMPHARWQFTGIRLAQDA